MNLDETTDNILRRARQREAELKKLESELHGNENLTPVRKETPKKSILSPIQSPLKPISSMNRSEDENSSPPKSERKSRFAKLAAEFDEFECDLKPHNLTKENVVKGPQKRISMGGETRASVLFTPGYVPQPTERRSIASKQDKLTPEKKPSLSTTIFEEEPKSPKTLGLSFWANATSETSL
uniref:Uncharacterized protein n=1 Tax=Acrobeloides nanus TaxID=290746 RepID=A0A914C1S0_9BILA